MLVGSYKKKLGCSAASNTDVTMTVGLTPHVCNVGIPQNVACKNKRATRRRDNAQISVKIEKIEAETAQDLAEIYALLVSFVPINRQRRSV